MFFHLLFFKMNKLRYSKIILFNKCRYLKSQKLTQNQAIQQLRRSKVAQAKKKRNRIINPKSSLIIQEKKN